MLPSPYTSAQLMQLGQAKAIRIHNDHQSGIWHVHPYLNDRCRYEQLYFVLVERTHDLILFRSRHPTMQKPNLKIRKCLRHRYI
ncbi:hypothetical protein D3C80_1931110 [compost metagenome]